MSEEWTERLEEYVKCPYCGHEHQIDEPYEYENGEVSDEQCSECDREFKMGTQIITRYYFKSRKLKEGD